MINVSDPGLYQSALGELASFKRSLGRENRGRFVQLFLALKFYQNEIPSMISNQYISTEVLQAMIDDLYAKASRPLNDCVLMLFEGRYLARTGLVGLGNATTQNTWRNNFNLQKGVGCYAPLADLASQTFLDQDRHECRYLVSGEQGVLRGGTCQLSLRGATYRSEEHRKWLKIEPGGSGYAVIDLLNMSNFRPYVAPNGTRIPIVPLLSALYYDCLPGLPISGHTEIDLADFASAFHFSSDELTSYFDDSETNRFNRALLEAYPNMTYTRIAGVRPRAITRVGVRHTGARRERAIPPPVLTGTAAPPPGANTGWEAEQYAAALMRSSGWTVYDVSRQRLGYDLLVQRGRQTRYVDVKSSLGLCSPTLTSREWQQAKAHGGLYVLAIIENFNPAGENVIFWVSNPHTTCATREFTTVQHAISRTAWVAAVVPMTEI
jgi:hypothetical protein